MKEEDLLKKLKKSADDLVIPESLEPEQMMKKLNSLPPKQKRWIKPLRYSTVAAAAMMSVVILTQVGELQKKSSMIETNEQLVAEDNSIEEIAVADHDPTDEFVAQSYDEIYRKLHRIEKQYEQEYGDGSSWWGELFGPRNKKEYWDEERVTEDQALNMPSSGAEIREESTGASEKTETKDFTDTNVQVAGIDEGDIVKTDGNYIYIASSQTGTIRIVKVDGDEMMLLSEITDSEYSSDGGMIQEFYINGDLLSVIRQSYSYPHQYNERADYPYYYSYEGETILETYDLSNHKDPRLQGSITQDGIFLNSRRSGDYIYLFTNFSSASKMKKSKITTFIPSINDEILPYDCIYLPENIDSFNYVIISAVNMNQPAQVAGKKAVLADGGQFYVSQNHIYIGSTKYDGKANQYNYTELLKLSYQNGNIDFSAHGYLNGYLNDQFSMDEYNGNLRVVTTLDYNTGKRTNSLYVYDDELKKIGAIEDLAPDEMIYSARFMGDTGYFVTFRNMDPLFSVDLTDPNNPQIMGELKITGFSEYLHFFEDDLLLGIGKEIEPESGRFEGLKLSMFDISAPQDVSEINKMVEQRFEYSPAWNNHKAVLISGTKNIIGFVVEAYDQETRDWSVNYLVYSYDREQGFIKQMEYSLDQDYYVEQTRGMCIGDWFYIVTQHGIVSFDLNRFAQMSQLKF